MTQFEIKITGSGTQNQLAISLLEIGRMLQLAESEEEFADKTFEDHILITEIKT